jgi:hypothetical protein
MEGKARQKEREREREMCQEAEDRDRRGVCGRVRVHLGARACMATSRRKIRHIESNPKCCYLKNIDL